MLWFCVSDNRLSAPRYARFSFQSKQFHYVKDIIFSWLGAFIAHGKIEHKKEKDSKYSSLCMQSVLILIQSSKLHKWYFSLRVYEYRTIDEFFLSMVPSKRTNWTEFNSFLFLKWESAVRRAVYKCKYTNYQIDY